MTPLSPQDQMFLLVERRNQPMHVGSLMLLSPPPDAGPNYAQELADWARSYTKAQPPFNQLLTYKLGLPFWTDDTEFDLEAHFHHISLPKPGRIRELLAIVSKLHSGVMDRAKPLWEIYIIDGVEDGRVAVYSRIHHALVDGVAGMRMLQRSMSPDPSVRDTVPFWAIPPRKRAPADGVVAKDQVIDLTGKTDWEAPDGKWMIYRFGHTTMGTLIQPAQWKAVGLECDKMSPEAVKFHLNHVLGEIQSHLGDLIGTGFTHVHLDSYEAGVPGWTPRMREEFAKRRGYELTPFLATLAKRTVGSEEETRKFQSDFLDTIKDLYRDVYFTTIQQMLHAAKLTFLCEPYGGPWRQDEILPKTPDERAPFPSYRHAMLDVLRSLADPRVGAQWNPSANQS